MRDWSVNVMKLYAVNEKRRKKKKDNVKKNVEDKKRRDNAKPPKRRRDRRKRLLLVRLPIKANLILLVDHMVQRMNALLLLLNVERFLVLLSLERKDQKDQILSAVPEQERNHVAQPPVEPILSITSEEAKNSQSLSLSAELMVTTVVDLITSSVETDLQERKPKEMVRIRKPQEQLEEQLAADMFHQVLVVVPPVAMNLEVVATVS
mmetsp:Transcript_4686/g.5136  ORF Transcript_4686/g.5136 Transcript_4686/m.5136 type:complete len:207 (+) Transcript_4686:2510-3130(+)